jgi:hypothetical protein
MRSFVGMNNAARRDSASNRHYRSIFRLEHERQSATATLAHANDDAALAGLV